MKKKLFILKTFICVILLQANNTSCMQVMGTECRHIDLATNLHRIIKELKYTPNITPSKREHKEEIINDLLQIGVDINTKNEYEETPLHAYLKETRNRQPQNMDWHVVKFLIEKGAQVNVESDEETLFYDTLNNTNLSLNVIKVLGANGFNVTQSIDGNFPLNLYLERNCNVQLGIVKYMVEQGANVNGGDIPPLYHYLAEQNDNIKPEIVKYMLEQEANVNFKDRHGRTLLQQAIENPHIKLEVIVILMDNGAQITPKIKKIFLNRPESIREDIRSFFIGIFTERRRLKNLKLSKKRKLQATQTTKSSKPKKDSNPRPRKRRKLS